VVFDFTLKYVKLIKIDFLNVHNRYMVGLESIKVVADLAQ